MDRRARWRSRRSFDAHLGRIPPAFGRVWPPIGRGKTTTLSQSLHGTAAWKTSLADQLQGSYFERLIVDPTETFARSLERREAKLKDQKTRLEFSIEHFSGYMVSVGDGTMGIKVEVTIDITGR